MIKEWENEPNHEVWIDEETGYKCEIIRIEDMGHLCGYVIVPETHPYYDHNKIHLVGNDPEEVNVHGGITYHEEGKIGFDCAHSDDYAPAMEGFLNPDRLMTYKNWQYVKNEVLGLAKALRLLE